MHTVTIPNSVTLINKAAFDCPLLRNVYFIGTQSEWNSIRVDHGNDPLLNATLHLIEPAAPSVPATQVPTVPPTEAPVTEPPTTEAPTTEAPTTEAPTTETPTTEAPVTVAPTTEAPTTEAPTTEAPTTETPTTEAPTIEEPHTEVPAGDLGSKDTEKAIVNEAKKQIAVLPGMTAEELKDVLDGDVKIVDAEGNELGAGDKIGTGARVIAAAGVPDLLGMEPEELEEFLDGLGLSHTIDPSGMSKEELRDALSQFNFTYTDEDGNVISYSAAETEYEIVVPGDTDGDGKVGAGDARSALRASARIEPLDGAYESAADIDVNGSVKASDARTILRVAAKLEIMSLRGR